MFRARFSVVQKREVFQAINNLQLLDYKQADAVRARIELDLRIGAAFTRFQTLTFCPQFPAELEGRVVSYGGCQFPTLGFVVEQYWRRERFIPESFWKISVVDRRVTGEPGNTNSSNQNQQRNRDNDGATTTVTFNWD